MGRHRDLARGSAPCSQLQPCRASKLWELSGGGPNHFSANSSRRRTNSVPLTISNRVGTNGAMLGSVAIPGANSEVVVTSPSGNPTEQHLSLPSNRSSASRHRNQGTNCFQLFASWVPCWTARWTCRVLTCGLAGDTARLQKLRCREDQLLREVRNHPSVDRGMSIKQHVLGYIPATDCFRCCHSERTRSSSRLLHRNADRQATLSHFLRDPADQIHHRDDSEGTTAPPSSKLPRNSDRVVRPGQWSAGSC